MPRLFPPNKNSYMLSYGRRFLFVSKKQNINCDLKVVPMTGWTRDMYYDDTKLQTWVMPSPNMPTLDTAIVYAGICIFEGTNVLEGRGQNCGGIQLYVTDRRDFNSIKTGLAILYTIRDMYTNYFKYRNDNYEDFLTGDSYVREGKYTLEQLFQRVDTESAKFK
ncbi:MAG: DUF1343 domain-containing protein, partial [Clostridiaceae bacterium]|nr:DUF1343 domain-containing protein [Clostridiaceae bacterium]